MDDLERLKELAEKATPGPWAHVPDDDIPGQREPDMVRIAGAYWQQQSGGLTYNSTVASANAAYIAAANPEAVLKLIARVRELEANQRTPGFIEKCPECGCQEDLNLANPRLHERCRIEDCPSP